MNMFNAAILHVNIYTSLTFVGDFEFMIALICTGLAYIPLLVTMYPNNFPAATPK